MPFERAIMSRRACRASNGPNRHYSRNLSSFKEVFSFGACVVSVKGRTCRAPRPAARLGNSSGSGNECRIASGQPRAASQRRVTVARTAAPPPRAARDAPARHGGGAAARQGVVVSSVRALRVRPAAARNGRLWPFPVSARLVRPDGATELLCRRVPRPAVAVGGAGGCRTLQSGGGAAGPTDAAHDLPRGRRA